jgi:curli biogenesis system outer membrane secretion channel CsgG
MRRDIKKLLLLLIVIPISLFAKESIAVNDLVGKNIDKETTSILSDRVRSELINTGVYKVMERSEMDVVLKEQGFQKSGACDDASCMVEVGQLLGVEKMFSGSIGKIGSKFYTLNIRMINVSSGEIEISINFDYDESLQNLVSKGIKEAVESLMKKVEAISGGVKEKITDNTEDKAAKDKSEKEKATQDKAEKDKKQHAKIEKEKAEKAKIKLLSPEQRYAKRKKAWQWVRRVGFGSITAGAVTAGILVDKNISSLYDDYNSLGHGDDNQEKMEAKKDEIGTQKLLRNILYGVGGAAGVGFVISIPF